MPTDGSVLADGSVSGDGSVPADGTVPADPGLADGRRAELAGRLDAVAQRVRAGGGWDELRRLLGDCRAELGPDDRLSLRVECGLEMLRSQRRPVATSAEVFDVLLARAGRHLDGDEPTLMSIRGLTYRYARLRGLPGDLDTGVHRYEDEWRRRREVLGVWAHQTRIAHANLAVALRDQDTAAGLRRAGDIVRWEADTRARDYGDGHSFTGSARAVLAQTLVRQAEALARREEGDVPGTSVGSRGSSTERAALEAVVTEAADLAAVLIELRRRRHGWVHPRVLEAYLVRAHALLVLGEAGPAERDVAHVLAVCRRTGAWLEPGWAHGLLARAQAITAPAQALRTAREALRLRLSRFPDGSRPVREAERVVDLLSATA